MNTMPFFPSGMGAQGMGCIDYVTGALLVIVSAALIALIFLYVCAGICKRVR